MAGALPAARALYPAARRRRVGDALRWAPDFANDLRSGATIETTLAVALLVALLGLALATYAQLHAVRALARHAGAQADATTRAVELGQAQRRDAVRPVLALALAALAPDAEPTTARFRLVIANAGTGPAFDVVVTPLGMPDLTEVAGVGPGRFVGAGRELTVEFATAEVPGRGAWRPELGEGQPGGELLVAYRDSFNGERTTRARLATTHRLEREGVYGLRVASQGFGT